MQAHAAEDLREKLLELIHQAGFITEVSDQDIDTFVTPRRLTGVVRNVPVQKPDIVIERKGPRVGAPEQALQGFLKANGLVELEQAEIKETDKGRFYFAVRLVKGHTTAKALQELVPELVFGFAWPKSMRWANTAVRWVRPINSVLCIFDGAPL